MSVSLTVDQTQSISQTGDITLYTVAMSVAASEGIELDVFVFDENTQALSRIATVYDMRSYPVGRVATQAAGLDYYRGRSFELAFSSVATAQEFIATVHQRLLTLTHDTDRMQSSFAIGQQTLTFSSEN